MASRLGVFGLFLVACSSGETLPDHQLYRQALEDGERTAEERLALCGSLSNAPARGDCGANVVQWAARTRHLDPDALCAEVEQGTWQAECYFQMAEHWRRKKNKRKAVSNCAQSGPFRNDCAQHLWQGELRELTRPRGADPLEPAQFSELMPKVERLYAQWEELLQSEPLEESDFEARFWRLVFQQVLEIRPGIDMRYCDPLLDVHRMHCRRASAHLYLRRLQQFLPRGGGIQRFCSLAEESLTGIFSGALGPVGLEALEDPLLVEVLERAFAHVCVRKESLPVSSDWLLPPG